MPTYDILGVPVEFPYAAYSCQLAYMEAVVRALEAGENALLESPTGTGKTLCLLCASLGWRRHHEQMVQTARTSWEADMGTAGARTCPRIFYSSRTHSQLQQVVKELRRTSYTPSTVVLGSREHFCVHASVSRHNGCRQNAMCRRVRDENRCPFFTGLKRHGSKINASLMDIEEIVSACKERMVCPFYKTREAAQDAELLFIPYDYLINPQTRDSLQVSLKDSLLIFDEGHNIERSCESMASFELKAADIAGCISEIDDASDVLEKEAEVVHEALGDMSPEQLMSHLNLLKRNLLALEDSICAERLEEDPSTQRRMLKRRGSHILGVFAKGSPKGEGIEPKDMKRVSVVIRKAIMVLTYSMESLQSGGLFLDKLQTMLTAIFSVKEEELDQNYQFLLHEEVDEGRKGQKRKVNVDWFSSAGPAGARNETPRTLCLWCFSCSIVLQELLRREVRTLVVTSGTLSPVEGTIEAYGVPFPVVLQNGHVVDTRRQLWGGVLRAGPGADSGQADAIRLNSSYKVREEPSYIRSLGEVVMRFAEFVPDGVLLAFPSYATKERVLRTWRQTGLFEEIQKQKPIYEEPQGNAALNAVMLDYDREIQRSHRQGETGGAILAAVCRGKICEGIDFTDRQCRMVILVGIPYPAKVDLRVVLKQDFLDARGAKGDGQRWYEREAIRAVNQTLGRVIRHKDDFGAVALCDERFAANGRLSHISAGLSPWLRPEVAIFDTYGEALSTCRRFFGIAQPSAPPRAPPPPPPAQSSSTAADAPVAAAATTSAAAPGPSKKHEHAVSEGGVGQMSSAAPAAGRSTSDVASSGTPLSVALGARWRERHAVGRAAQTAGAEAVRTGRVGVTSSGGSQGLGCRPNAAVRGGVTRAPATPLSVAPRVPAKTLEDLEAQRRKKLEASLAASWLQLAQELLPRAELGLAHGHLQRALQLARQLGSGGADKQEAEGRFHAAICSTAGLLLPKICFDTLPEQMQRRELVRVVTRLLPEPWRPAWRECVASHGRAEWMD